MQVPNWILSLALAGTLIFSPPLSPNTPEEMTEEEATTTTIESNGLKLVGVSPIEPSPRLRAQDFVTPDSAMIPSIDPTGTVIKNYPRVSRQTACRKLKAGETIFTISWSGLVCMPLSIWNPGVGFACGIIGDVAMRYLPKNTVCY